jgi:hypothetical protein
MHKVNRIRTEEPYRKLWDMFVFFENEQTASRFLRDKYEQMGLPEAKRYSYLATPKFMYSIKQAREYYKAAACCDIVTKPLLLYYGMMSLARALITTRDPEYPSTTSVLKHGLSTRKLKRSDYQFATDEIRIQKDGLFVVLHQTLDGPPLESGQRFRIQDLLSVLPELIHCYEQVYGPPSVCEVDIQPCEGGFRWKLPRSIVQASGKTRAEFLALLNRYSETEDSFTYPDPLDEQGWLCLHQKSVCLEHPLILDDISGNFHFRLPHESELIIPEISLHFMLMFVLGMLCRYETERWGELVLAFMSQDMYIINEFLNVSMRKFPNLILNHLFEEKFLFYTP